MDRTYELNFIYYNENYMEYGGSLEGTIKKYIKERTKFNIPIDKSIDREETAQYIESKMEAHCELGIYDWIKFDKINVYKPLNEGDFKFVVLLNRRDGFEEFFIQDVVEKII